MFSRLFGRSPADPSDALITWLSDKSLDDRRIVVGILYGGPYSLKVCKWVLSQPDCDKGTATMVLWNFGVLHSLVKGPHDSYPARRIKRELIAFITDRWRKGLFRPAVFEWDPREHVKIYRRELAIKGYHARDPFMIPDEAWLPAIGRGPEGAAVGAEPMLDELLHALKLADLAALDPAMANPAADDD